MSDRTPDGYMMDAAGRLVRLENVKPEHLLEDQTVRDLHGGVASVREQLRQLREKALDAVDAYLDLLAKEYGQLRGERAGAKGNITLTSYDGTLRVMVAVSDTITFGAELSVAKQLIDECLTRWSEGADANIQTLVMDAFRVGQQGRLQVDRILGLRRLHIEDKQWRLAMDAIGAAVKTERSKRYVRFYCRMSPDAKFTQLPLDIASV